MSCYLVIYTFGVSDREECMATYTKPSNRSSSKFHTFAVFSPLWPGLKAFAMITGVRIMKVIYCVSSSA